MTHIKISGITDPEDARLAARLGVDMVACVFYARSQRYVTQSAAWAIRRALPGHVALVGIFVDTPLPIVQQVTYHCRLDHVQLFGSETRADVEAIRPHAFKAVTVTQPELAERAVRAFLGTRGGRHDAPAMLVNLTREARERWSCLATAAGRHPLLLASPALSATTAGAAIRIAQPWGVDVWEAVEASPGRLDPERVAAFVDAVRAADTAAADDAAG
ncbi:N-(5'-phosphoribosyl)anthranilate isomerase [bacterium]|nr:phosphoribosylanthranilate isomerase [Chloroflexi bacterium CFX6]RIL11708.1 MAG: N-(5'-phosphoribosyl)anthranilate isomerase [bacterium]